MTITQPQTTGTKPSNWLVDLIKKVNSNAIEQQQITTRARNDSLCILCKGARALCGKTRCPIMVKVNYFLKSVPLMASENIDGMSPLRVRSATNGSPKPRALPPLPAVQHHTGIYDLPER